MKRTARAIALTFNPRLHRASALMAFLVVCSLLLYGIFLLEAVGSTAKRASAEREIRTITAELSTMQARYLAYTKEISPERAEALGFVTPTEVSTVYASSRPLTFSSQ